MSDIDYMEHLRLEIERPLEGSEIGNLIQNPSGALGAWGWGTPYPLQYLKGGDYWPADSDPALIFQVATSANTLGHITTERMTVEPGKYVVARLDLLQFNSLELSVRYSFEDAQGQVVGSTTGTTYSSATGTLYVPAVVVPVGATAVTLRLDIRRIGGGSFTGQEFMIFRNAMLTTVASATGLGSYPFEDPRKWRDILGPTHEISIGRQGLDVGTLTATILDATLDPSESTLVRPGKRLRLTADGEALFTGKVDNATVTYEPLQPVEVKRARVVLTALDPATDLANQAEERGVGLIDDLPFILEGKGVPWEVNGSGDQVVSATQVSTNENASVLDQVVVTRDSELGYAWVSRNGVLVANTSAWMSLEPGGERVTNGSFETDLTGWSALTSYPTAPPEPEFYGYGTTIARTTTRASSGVASLQMTLGSEGVAVAAISDPFEVTPGRAFTLSADLLTLVGGNDILRVQARFYDASGAWIDGGVYSYSATTVETASVWASIALADTIPRGAVTARVVVAGYNLDAGQQVWADNVHFEVAEVTPYPLGEDVYSDAEISFDTAACINEVTVKYLRPNPETGETEEIAYGPYRDEASIREWGARSAEFAVQGFEESEANVAAYAAVVLEHNAVPVVRCNRLAIPIRHAADVAPGKALLDLYDPVEVSWDGGAKSSLLWPTSIEHRITTSGWTVEVGFDRAEGVAAPTQTPSPQTPSVLGGRLEVGMAMQWPDATPPAGWLVMDGSQFDGNTYPALASLLGDKFGAISGSLYRLPLRNDVPQDVANTSSGVLASTSSGFSINNIEAERVGNMVHLFAIIERTGATLSYANPDHANVQVCALSTKWRPRREVYTMSGNGIRSVMIRTDGTIHFTAGISDTAAGSSAIPQGRTWQIGVSYIAEDPAGARLYWIIKAA